MSVTMAMPRALILVVALLSLAPAGAPAVASAAPGSGSSGSGPGQNDPARGLVYDGTRPAGPQRPCGEALELAGRKADRVRCTHGPDPAPGGLDVRARRQAPAIVRDTPAPPPSTAAAGSGAVQCYGDGSSGARVQLVYAVAAGQPDQYNAFVASFQQIAAELDDVFVRSAAETGGTRHPRFVTVPSGGGCTPVVAHAQLSATGADTFDNTINELDSLGYNRFDRKYLVWVDANVYCGIAEVYNDDRATQDNPNNGLVPGMFARVDNGCWGLSGTNLVEAHELMHTLGGVQSSATHGTSKNHCIDNYDRMCYADGSLQGNSLYVTCADPAHEALYDCNHDDYFTTTPRPGLFNYLNLHWNTANNVFLGSSGSVGAWGYNGAGELGDGTTSSTSQAQEVPNMLGAGAVGAGAYHSLAVLGGVAVAWGDNSHGQLGDGTTVTRTQPVAVTGLSNVKAVAGGIYHSIALKNDGTVWAWGWNAIGQVGDGTTTERHLPVQVPGLTNVAAIAAGAYHGLAVRADGTVVSWGWNLTGQLGDGTTVTRLSPVPVSGLTGITSVAAGVYHSLAVRSDGGVRAWGWNVFGQLGDYSSTQRLTPVGVANLGGVTAIAAGAYHSLAVTNGGFVVAWGWNGHGQLGDGTTQNRDHPVAVAGLSGGVSALAAGFYHSLAVTAAGTPVAWGWNYFGQIGDGTTTSRTTAATVIGASTAYKIAGGGLHSLST
jgi:alpha-tubulin suppressor-like RCC1 family protein